MNLTSMTIHAAIVGASVLACAGCSNRGADDRVEADIRRTDMGRPGYAVVAWRQVDYARLSGNAVILTNGEEPVLVQQAAYYHAPVEDRGTAAANTKLLLTRLEAVEQRLAAQVEGQPHAEAPTAPGTVGSEAVSTKPATPAPAAPAVPVVEMTTPVPAAPAPAPAAGSAP